MVKIVKIGNVKIGNSLVLAPMVGINCLAFRKICKSYGAGLVSTPMIFADLLQKDPETALRIVEFSEDERPLSCQLVGNGGKKMGDAANVVEDYCDIIDVNLGCPENDAVKFDAGAYFSKYPEKIEKVVKPITDSTNKPVTAKIRIGWNNKSVNTLKSVKILQDLGISAIAIHARTKEQGYSGKADWSEIAKAKEISNVPIIGNGDVFKPGTAKAMLDYTGCDLVMIGRGAKGNPLIFKQTDYLLKNNKNMAEPSVDDRVKCFFEFVSLYKKQKRQVFSELRHHSLWFTYSIPGAKRARENILKAKTVEEIKEIYESLR